MADPIIVLMTAAHLEEAESIAQELVNKQLAACVNIIPNIVSLYRWNGQLCRDPEVLMVAKTTRERFAQLEQAVRHGHSYDVPEIIALTIVDGSTNYLRWLVESVAPPETR